MRALPDAQRKRLQFVTRQYVDAIAPTNFRGDQSRGARARDRDRRRELRRRAWRISSADMRRGRISMSDESAFEVGRNLATTPGSVVFRNELIEVIQYAPTTPTVHTRPLVIVPPCINKYYILDLTPANSFVRHAVAQGHTTFIVSWRNIPPELGHLTWDDYLERGVLQAIGVARAIGRQPDASTRWASASAARCSPARSRCSPRAASATVESATFLTTMLDFDDPGDIGVYVTREFLAAREPALLAGPADARRRARDRVRDAARERPRLELRRQQLPEGRDAARVRPAALERRLGEPAGPDVRVLPARAVPRTTGCASPVRLTMLGERIDLSRIDVPALRGRHAR